MRLFTAALISSVVLSAAASPHGSNDLRHAAPLVRDAHANRLAGHARDASTDMSKVGPENTEGEVSRRGVWRWYKRDGVLKPEMTDSLLAMI